MKTLAIAALAATSLLAACSDGEAPKADPNATAEEAVAAPLSADPVDPDDDAAEPTEAAAEHGHPHDGEDADHSH